MANKEMTVVINGKEYVSKSATKAGKSLSGLQKNAKDVTKTLAKIGGTAAAIAAVAYSIQKLTDAYGNQIEKDQKLESALLATKNSLGLTKGELGELSTAMSRMTGIADEAITEAQALMVTFTKIGAEVFPAAIDSAADMSAMFGQDLQQSVIQLGTALNDPIAGVGRLKRIGISFTQEQKNMIQSFMDQNDVMSAQMVIIDELNAEFGGVAQNMGQDWPKKVDRFHNAFTDGKEIIGEYLAEGIEPALSKITTFIEGLNDARKAQKGFNDIWSSGGADDIADYEQALKEAQSRIEGIQGSLGELKETLAGTTNGFQIERITKQIEYQEKNLRLAMADWESIDRILNSINEVNAAIAEKNKERADEAARILELEESIDQVLLDLGDKKQQEIDAVQEQINQFATYRQELRDSGSETSEVQQALNLLVEKRNKLLKEQTDALNTEKKSSEEIIRQHRLLDDLIEDATSAYDQQIQALEQIPELEQLIFQAADEGNTAWLSQLAEIKEELYEIAGIELPEGEGSSSGSETELSVGGELGTIIQAIQDGGDIWVTLINIILSSLSSFEQFNNVLNIISTLISSISQTVILPLLQVLMPFLAFFQAIVQMIGTALYPWLQVLVQIMSVIAPILELLGQALLVVLTPVVVLGAIIKWVGDLLGWMGSCIATFIENLGRAPWDQKAYASGPGNLGTAITDAIGALYTASTSPFDALSFDTPGMSSLDFSGGSSVYGGDTSVTRVPDIYLYQTFHGPIVGDGGMEEFGELTIQAIQEYVGAGGTVVIEATA